MTNTNDPSQEFEITAPGAKFDPRKHIIFVQGGRPYLPVSARILWFRHEKPDWGIVTEPIEINIEKKYAIFHAKIYNPEGRLMATGTKDETVAGFNDFITKAETGAVGRALAFLGYGTQFESDLDEDNRGAQQRDNRNGSQQQRPAPQQQQQPADSRSGVTAPAQATTAQNDARTTLFKDTQKLLMAVVEQYRPKVHEIILARYGKELSNLTLDMLTDFKPRITNISKLKECPQFVKWIEYYMAVTHAHVDPQISDEIDRVWGINPSAYARFEKWFASEFSNKPPTQLKGEPLKNAIDVMLELQPVGDTHEQAN